MAYYGRQKHLGMSSAACQAKEKSWHFRRGEAEESVCPLWIMACLCLELSTCDSWFVRYCQCGWKLPEYLRIIISCGSVQYGSTLDDGMHNVRREYCISFLKGRLNFQSRAWNPLGKVNATYQRRERGVGRWRRQRRFRSDRWVMGSWQLRHHSERTICQ